MSFFIVHEFVGSKIDKTLAATICAKIIYDYFEQDFSITNINYNSFFNLYDTRVEIMVLYKNGLEVSSDCIIKRVYKFNNINVRQALIIDSHNRLHIINNIKILFQKT